MTVADGAATGYTQCMNVMYVAFDDGAERPQND